MPQNWKTYKLGELTDIIMGISPKGETTNNNGNGLPLLNGPTEFGYSFPTPTQYTIDPKKVSEVGDLLFCVRGSTTGRMNFSDQPYAIGRGIGAFRGSNGYSTKYIKYVIDFYLGRMLALCTGSTFPNLSRADLESFKVVSCLPKESDAIASILSALDDKIELNLQMNKTLEEMAMVLYKHWFVDFGPFQNGEFVDSELGRIPMGWEVNKLRRYIHITNGYAFKGTDFIDNGVPVLKIKNVKAGKVLLDNLSFVSGEVSIKAQKARINFEDILITMTGNRFAGTPSTWVGKVAMFLRKGEYYLNQRVSKMNIKDESIMSKYYLSSMLSSDDFQYFFITNSTSSGGQANISPDLIYNTPIIVPPKHEIKKFNDIVLNQVHRIYINELEIETLTELRNTLLPKLISGEVRVKEAEKTIAALI